MTSTGYGTGPGLGGWNCRHSFFPFFPGISQNAYDAETRKDLRNKKVTLAGKEISMYDATQIQRGIERKIRYWKRQAAGMDAAGLDASAENAQVATFQKQMRIFVSDTQLPRQAPRERI